MRVQSLWDFVQKRRRRRRRGKKEKKSEQRERLFRNYVEKPTTTVKRKRTILTKNSCSGYEAETAKKNWGGGIRASTRAVPAVQLKQLT